MPDRRLRSIKIVLFLLIWASCSWFGSWELNTNNAVRLYATLAIVEHGEATIDQFDSVTTDKARFGQHLYLDKAPGMTLMAIPAVAALHALSPARSSDYQLVMGDGAFARFVRVRTRLAVATGPALLTAIAAILLFDLALSLTGSATAALASAIAYGLGTPAWAWSTSLLGHAPLAALYIIALWAALRATEGEATRRWPAFLLGLVLGWAVVVEYPAVIAGGVIALWTAWRAWRRPDRVTLLGLATIGGLIGISPLFAYNLFAFGNPLQLGYQGVVGFDGMNRGLFGVGLPNPEVLWRITLGQQRGLFWFAPVLLLGLWGVALMIRERRTRDIGLVVLAVSVITLLINAGYYYWDGGYSTGPRHSVPIVGLLALGIAPAWMKRGRGAGRYLPAEVIVLSIVINACFAATNIYGSPSAAFQLREVVMDPFVSGQIHTLVSDWLSWSPGTGFILWQAIAMPVLYWLGLTARDVTKA
jgi:4-amino-4-deoxy-L-arabinose transferase-like glycosyltransferase